jgi:surfactin synthase thioesterase subunit
MPLTLEELQDIQLDAMADDIEIDFEKMSLWSKDDAVAFFESGGEVEPRPKAALPPLAAKLPTPSPEMLKQWFPKIVRPKDGSKPKFRLVCFHSAGCSETTYTGRGMRMPTENPFVLHCSEKGGELLAVQLPGRDAGRNLKRERDIPSYMPQLFPVLAPLLQEDIPYVFISHSMGTWFSYEFLKMLCEKGIPLPKLWLVSGFPAPSLPEAERPWSKNTPMSDPQFFEEARGWNVNEILFQDSNWKTFGGMMRDDFTLFDEYVYTPPPSFLPDGEFPIPIIATWFTDDKRSTQKYLELWKAFTTEKGQFQVTEHAGNHLFFYQYPERAKWMEFVIKQLPAGFGN